jgi:hypothetical protein
MAKGDNELQPMDDQAPTWRRPRVTVKIGTRGGEFSFVGQGTATIKPKHGPMITVTLDSGEQPELVLHRIPSRAFDLDSSGTVFGARVAGSSAHTVPDGCGVKCFKCGYTSVGSAVCRYCEIEKGAPS